MAPPYPKPSSLWVLALAILAFSTPSTCQRPSSQCLDALVNELTPRIEGCSNCFLERGQSAEAARACCTNDSQCISLIDGLQSMVETSEACTDADREVFDLSILASIGLYQQLGDVCASEATSGDGAPDEEDACSPPAPGPMKLCMVHNDPHVLMFDWQDGEMLTCNSVGNFTLVDNEHFSITAIGEALSEVSSNSDVPGASVVTSVTFSFKNNSCGEDKTLDDQGSFTAPGLNTRMDVSARQTSSGQRFLAVRVTTPFVQGSSGVCIGGCPESQVDIRRGQSPSRKLLQGSEGNSSSAYEQAEEACRSEGLQGDFFHACVHDTAFSGDNVFVESAKQDSAVYEEARNSLGSDGSGSSNGSSSAGHVHHPSSILLIASLLGASMLYSMV